MHALEYWKAVTADQAGLLERVVSLLREHDIRFCVIGGQAVNAYVEPVVSLDLDLAVAIEDLTAAEDLLAQRFEIHRFPHSSNISSPDSDLRIQIQTDPRYSAFVARASVRDVLGLPLPVAAVDDVLDGKIWAVMDSGRRASKRQKDLADIARLLEVFPGLRSRVPPQILDRLLT